VHVAPLGHPPPYNLAVTLFLWLILLVLCWPVALLAVVLYPIVWLLLLPFRLVGIVVDGVFEFLKALLLLPVRLLGAKV
jgi:hypothetical protein